MNTSVAALHSYHGKASGGDGLHCKYVQWNYSEDTCKNCKTELQWFTVACTSICHTQ